MDIDRSVDNTKLGWVVGILLAFALADADARHSGLGLATHRSTSSGPGLAMVLDHVIAAGGLNQ